MSVLSDRIVEVARQAHRSKTGEEEFQHHDLRALIEAMKAVDAVDDDTAGALASRGLRFTKLIPPGGGGD